MTNDEALQLAKQGFTADEIKALGWTATSSYNEPKVGDEPKVGENEPNPEENSPEQNSDSQVNETIKSLTETVNSLTETVKAMQEANQKTAKKSKNDNAPKSADEVIKGFIENM